MSSNWNTSSSSEGWRSGGRGNRRFRRRPRGGFSSRGQFWDSNEEHAVGQNLERGDGSTVWSSRGQKRGTGSAEKKHTKFDGGGTSDTSNRGRHPPGLRGRDIGMWYAKRSRTKPELEQRININQTKVQEISNLLQQIHGGIQPAAPVSPSTSTALQWTNSVKSNAFQRQFAQHRLDSDMKQLFRREDYCQGQHGIARNPKLDRVLLDEYKEKETSMEYQEMLKNRKKLPAYDKVKEILTAIQDHQVIVISGETGCGKTTQVPQFILDDCIKAENGSLCRIICTQPRRISAITVAERVASERIERCGCGLSVGYKIRLEEKLPRDRGSILYCTTGMVLKFLESDEWLKMASHLIIDEIHERDLDSDFLMIIVKDLLQARNDLKLVLMSATLNAEKFSQYFGDCKILNIPGFTFPVKEYFLEDVLEITQFRQIQRNQNFKPKFGSVAKTQNRQRMLDQKNMMKDGQDNYESNKETFLRTLQSKYSTHTTDSLASMNEEELDLNLVHALLKYICGSTQEGAILVFLPGWDSISKVNKLLENDSSFSPAKHLIFPLHSMMPTTNQREIFAPPPPGKRKIILSTNIAETSITIEDVVYVVDSGKIKLTTLDLDKSVATLQAEWVALANAHQRRGRAGRVKPGICYHLYTKQRESVLEQYLLPAILRERLEIVCLKIKMLKLGRVEPFLSKALDAPSPLSVQLSLKLLVALNALDAEENLTPLGYHLARLPLDPQMGKMILFGAMFSCLDPILTVAACLDYKDPFVLPLGKEKKADHRKLLLSKNWNSDHIANIEAFRGWEDAVKRHKDYQFCRENFLSAATLKLIQKMKQQLSGHLHDVKFIETANPKEENANINSHNMKLVRAIICAGLYPNVAKMIIKHKNLKPHGPTKRFCSRPPKISTEEDGRVAFHLKSVNAKAGQFESPWLVYHLKLKSNGILLHDTTMVPAYPLIFFGGSVKYQTQDGKDTVSVDDFIKFQCTFKTAKIILDLRAQLSGLLNFKITNPSCTNWKLDETEGQIMNAIVELITSEEVLMEEGIFGKTNEKEQA